MNLKYKILSLENKDDWSNYFEALPPDQQNIFWKPEYYKLFENFGAGVAKCFVYQEDDNIALYLFLLNSVNDLVYILSNGYFDIQDAYGYRG